MQALTWLTSVLAPGTTILTSQPTLSANAPAQANVHPLYDARALPLEMQPPGHAAFVPQPRAVAGGSNLSTRWNKCLDVKDGKYANGNIPQLWDCAQGNNNQQWALAGGLLKADNNMCVDVPSGNTWNGAPVQLWQCSQNNRNQQWEIAGNSIRKSGTNFCLDVTDGNYVNGARIQLWNCDNRSEGNQNFVFGKANQQTTQSASSFQGYASISIDRFSQLHPECAPYKDIFSAAAAANGLVPVLLAAVAETESSCQERPRNGWGLMQFSDDGAWRAYGDNGDRQKASDAIWAGARYIRTLLNQNNQNLDDALRAYNGPLSQGGNPSYQAEIRLWMSGGNPWA